MGPGLHPHPREGEIVVRNSSAAINLLDWIKQCVGSTELSCPMLYVRSPWVRSASWSGPASRGPESGYLRTWLDTMLDLAWNIRTTTPPM